MEKFQLWDAFEKDGKVKSYLAYKKVSKTCGYANSENHYNSSINDHDFNDTDTNIDNKN